MKTIISCVVCVILTVSIMIYWSNEVSEKGTSQTMVQTDRYFSPPYGAVHLVSIVWYKGPLQSPYKIFSNYQDIEDIRFRLVHKSGITTSDNAYPETSTQDRLTFVYYSQKENSFRRTYLPFQINDGNAYWPYGNDKRLAQILLDKEIWGGPSAYIRPREMSLFDNSDIIKERLGYHEKIETIKKIRKPLAIKQQLTTEEQAILDLCESALLNLMEIVSFYQRAEILDNILEKLNDKCLLDKYVHAFIELPGLMKKRYQKIAPKSIEGINQLGQKFNDEGLSRKEQVELFKIHQMMNEKILEYLKREQKRFEQKLSMDEPIVK